MSLTPPTPAEIKSFRALTGASQANLADDLGISKRAVEEWEAGRRAPPAYLRLALAAIKERLPPFHGSVTG